MIIDYKIMKSGSIQDLEELVNAKLKEGYELHGAPFAWAGICQAMILIKYDTLSFELTNALVNADVQEIPTVSVGPQ